MGTQTERIDLRVDPELRKALERLAVAKDRSIAWIVRDILKRHIEQEVGPTSP